MKPVPILLSLVTIGATAKDPVGEVMGGIRGRKLVTNKTKRDGASSRGGTKRRKTKNKRVKSSLNLKDDTYSAARQGLSRRNAIRDKLHNVLTKNDGRGLKVETQTNTQTQHKGQETNEQDRELKKAKSSKENYGGNWEDSQDYDWDDDDMWGGGGGWGSSDTSSKGGYIFGKADKGGGWGNGSGKSSNGGWGSWGGGSGKSGKDGWGSWGGGSGKSGKGGWGGGSGKSGKGGGGSCGDYHWVEVTNLSFQQSFSEIFIMTAAHEVTEWLPIYRVGNHSSNALASLAQDADASEMQDRYMHRRGVEQVKIFSDFDYLDDEQKYLQGGATAKFKISTSGDGERLSIAVGLPFTNDGVVVLQGAHIFDGAEYLVPPLDAGVEANIQTCWSVAAEQEDFPWQSECANDDTSDENFNDLPGEGFVHIHRGMHDLDNADDLEDLLLFPECEDILSDSELDGTERFARYFYEEGFDDDFLLCADESTGSSLCSDPRDDEDFLQTLEDYRYDYAGSRYFLLARQSDDFDDFCDKITEANDDLKDLFSTLEPWLFDWQLSL
ncbi:hypothetical protein ACHAW5_002786 [Stephanodiscus triporus]|uniref:Uncharacterized protein n=1 Tax=Stephanodiscus triporus TaxID=2934178 RepID=A0ABD3NYX7_9STRA